MENGPKIRTVGAASEEKKHDARSKIKRNFFDHFQSLSKEEQKELIKFEYPKSEIQFALIDFANKETSRLMQESSVAPYDIPADNFHIIPTELYKKAAGDGGDATAFSTKQGALFDAKYFRDKPVYFGAVIFHEMLHLKAHFSIEVEENDNKSTVTPYREGVTVRALQKHGYHGNYHEHFDGLHEAIVSETEKRFLNRLLDHPGLKKEKEWLMSDKAISKKIQFAREKNISVDDVIWTGKGGEKEGRALYYTSQREVFGYLCLEIQKQFSSQYKNSDEVYKVFLAAHFTGKLLPISRLVEKTFGEGGFRLLGNMSSTNRDSGVLCLEALKKARARMTTHSK